MRPFTTGAVQPRTRGTSLVFLQAPLRIQEVHTICANRLEGRPACGHAGQKHDQANRGARTLSEAQGQLITTMHEVAVGYARNVFPISAPVDEGQAGVPLPCVIAHPLKVRSLWDAPLDCITHLRQAPQKAFGLGVIDLAMLGMARFASATSRKPASSVAMK